MYSHTTSPTDPPSADWWRWATAQVGSQRRAARLLRVTDRTMRRWCSGESVGPWAAAELLRRMIPIRR